MFHIGATPDAFIDIVNLLYYKITWLMQFLIHKCFAVKVVRNISIPLLFKLSFRGVHWMTLIVPAPVLSDVWPLFVAGLQREKIWTRWAGKWKRLHRYVFLFLRLLRLRVVSQFTLLLWVVVINWLFEQFVVKILKKKKKFPSEKGQKILLP